MVKHPTNIMFERWRLAFHLISESNNKIVSSELLTKMSESSDYTYNKCYESLLLARKKGIVNSFDIPFCRNQLYSLSDFGVMFFAEAEEKGYYETWKDYFKNDVKQEDLKYEVEQDKYPEEKELKNDGE